MTNYLKFDTLNFLTLDEQEKTIKERRLNALAAIEQEATEAQISINVARVEEAKQNDPNYINHKITDDEVKILLKNIINRLAQFTLHSYQEISARKVIDEIWKDLARNQHSEWLGKVKHKNSGYIYKRIINNGFEYQLPSILVSTYKKLSPERLNFDKSLNKISKQIFVEIWNVMETEFLKNEVSELKKNLIEKNLTISSLKNDIEMNKVTPSKVSWKNLAIELKLQGYPIKEIQELVGKGRTAVSKALNTSEAKAILNKK